MKGKVCLVTGATDGIGFETAKALAAKGATVVIVGRSMEKCSKAVANISRMTNSNDVHFIVCDLSLQKNIHQLASEFREQFTRLDVLVNNAGGFFSDFQLTEDKIERTFALNHLNYFLLTNLLLSMLKNSAPSRIVNVSSRGHIPGKINWDDVNLTKKYSGLKAYNQSKLGNILFTHELTERMKGTGITSNCLHPGVVKTNIALKQGRGYAYWGWKLMQPFMISVEKGAATSIYLASSPEVENISGEYFEKCKSVKSSQRSYSKPDAKRLWELSEKMTNG